jgi:membrane protein YdbS with pleckstrin-like domain
LRKGFFWRKQIIQPLVRLQHIELARGPVDKYLDLAGLRIFSAGTGAETFTIPGLDATTAERMRQRLLDIQSTEG